jgi:hypothetical protein
MFLQGIAEGIRGLASAGPMGVLAVRKRFWRSTEGKIVGIDVQNVETPDGIRVPNYMLLYEYRVNNVQFFGIDRIPINAPYHAADDAMKDLFRQFPPGEKIQVFYSERNPQLNSARRDVVGLSKALSMVGFGIFAAVIAYLYYCAVKTSYS